MKEEEKAYERIEKCLPEGTRFIVKRKSEFETAITEGIYQIAYNHGLRYKTVLLMVFTQPNIETYWWDDVEKNLKLMTYDILLKLLDGGYITVKRKGNL